MERGGEERRKKSLETRCHWFGMDLKAGSSRYQQQAFRFIALSTKILFLEKVR